MASGVLLFLWTAWLVVALCRLGLKKGGPLLAAFGLLGIAVLFTSNHAWRPYLMAWLGVHALVACYDYLGGFVLDSRRASPAPGVRSAAGGEKLGSEHPRRILFSGVSLAGVLWLWIQGGALYWQYLVAAAGTIAGLIAVAWLSRWLWTQYQGRIQRRVDAACHEVADEAEDRLRKREAALKEIINQRDKQLDNCRHQLQAVSANYEAQDRALDQADKRIGSLTAEGERRGRRLATLEEDLRQRREREERERQAERGQVSDIFCCTKCHSIWLVTRQGDSHVTRRPAGAGCGVCTGPAGTMRGPSPIGEDDRLVTFHPRSGTVTGPAGSIPGVSAPVSSPTINLTGLESRLGDRPHTQDRANNRIRIGVKLGVDLAALDSTALSDDIADWASATAWDGIGKAIPADGCKLLSSLADALDSVPEKIADCVIWCARVAGVPQVIAEILGALARLAIEAHVAPLHTLAQEMRIIGTVACAAEGPDHLEHCQCARDLARAASAGLAANVIEDYLKPAVGDLRALEQPPVAMNEVSPVDPPVTNFRPTGGPSAL